jgi:hypothetical protein
MGGSESCALLVGLAVALAGVGGYLVRRLTDAHDHGPHDPPPAPPSTSHPPS